MEFDISKIINRAYRKIAEEIDVTSCDAKTKGNNKLDGNEISIFLNKVNEQEGTSYRESDVGILLGFESGPIKENKKTGYNPVQEQYDTILNLSKKLRYTKNTVRKRPLSREDYNIAVDLVSSKPDFVVNSISNKISLENVAYLMTEYKKENGVFLTDTITCNKLYNRASQLGIRDISKPQNGAPYTEDWVKNVLQKIEEKTKNTYFEEIINDGVIDKIVYSGNDCEPIAEIYYSDGRIIREEHGIAANGTKRTLLTETNQNILVNTERAQDEVAQPIKIDLSKMFDDKDLSTLNDRQKRRALEMAEALSETELKNKLMKALNINNETYDRYAKLTIALAARETQFGKGSLKDADGDKDIFKMLVQTVIAFNSEIYPPNIAGSTAGIRAGMITLNDPISFGLTGIKIDEAGIKANPETGEGQAWEEIEQLFEEFGIDATDLYSPKGCAIATLIAAKNRIDLFKGICADKGLDPEKVLQAEHYSNIEDTDVITNAWNRGYGFILDGTWKPEEWDYNVDVKRLIDAIEITSIVDNN